MNLILRWILGTAIAAFVTFALFVMMMTLIKDDFKPQEKVENASFEINPKVEDIKVAVRETKIAKIRKVVTPPPPPQIERQQASQPTVAMASLEGAIPDFEKPKLDRASFKIVVSDRDAQPLLRMRPIFPPRFLSGDYSGHCTVEFDVSPEGSPFNIETPFCTNRMLSKSTKKAVAKWKFNPKIIDGRAVSMRGVRNKVKYNLEDERGKSLPEPRR